MNKKIKNLIIVSGLTFGLVLFLIPSVKAVTLKDAFSGQLGTVGSRSGFNTSQRSVDPIIGTIISVILSFLGVIFLILMVYGGYIWMMAAGNDEKVTKAKNLIKAAIIGLIIVVGAYAITIFVMARISKDLIPETGGISSDAGSYDPIKGTETGTTGDVNGKISGCCYRRYDGAPSTCDMVEDVSFCKKIGDTKWATVFDTGKQCTEVSECQAGCCINYNDPPTPATCTNNTTQAACTAVNDFRLKWQCSDLPECK
jgi:hypothetical protein